MNFKRIGASFVKESILARRDRLGLAMLFGMPLAMIIIMAIVQDIPFRDYQDVKFNVLWLDEDQKTASDSLISYLGNTGQFELITQPPKVALTRETLRILVENGTYPVGVVIPKGLNAAIINKSNKLVNQIGKQSGQPVIYPVREDLDSIKILIAFDPAAKNTYRISVQNLIDKLIFKLQYDNLLQKLKLGPDSAGNSPDFKMDDMVTQLNQLKPGSIIISSVQHNVPAWTVFAIFFLIMPLAGNQIKENEAGSRIRLAMTPGTHLDILLGKVFFYMLVGIIQFIFLLLMSQLLLPFFGLPKLIVGQHWFLLILSAIVIAFPAISLGILIGNTFTTYHQAMMFGSILIILLSAVGGIWIPVAVLPHWLQLIAKVSPLHWALELINDTMLREFSLSSFILKVCILMGFGLLFLMLSRLASRKKVISH